LLERNAVVEDLVSVHVIDRQRYKEQIYVLDWELAQAMIVWKKELEDQKPKPQIPKPQISKPISSTLEELAEDLPSNNPFH
jgi:hypothetical protein